MNYEYENLAQILKEEEIAFIPLKGTVIKKMYPMPWFRTSSDIDLLINANIIEKLKKVLQKEHGFEFKQELENTYSVYTKNKVHIEFHTDLSRDFNENEITKNLDKYLKNDADNPYLKEMESEVFYTHFLAHTARHLSNAGCGVRAFIDIWLINKTLAFDRQKLSNLLNENGLTAFEKSAYKLGRVWFDDECHDDITSDLEEFVLNGGIYGNSENQIELLKKYFCRIANLNLLILL